jgi:hypothetical protein
MLVFCWGDWSSLGFRGGASATVRVVPTINRPIIPVVSRKISPSVEKGFNFTVLGKCVSTARRMDENQFTKAKSSVERRKAEKRGIG